MNRIDANEITRCAEIIDALAVSVDESISEIQEHCSGCFDEIGRSIVLLDSIRDYVAEIKNATGVESCGTKLRGFPK